MAKAIESARLDDRFAGLKPIVRQVGRVHFDRPKEEIRMLREIMDEMKVSWESLLYFTSTFSFPLSHPLLSLKSECRLQKVSF